MTKEQYDFVMKRAETDISEHMKIAKEVSDDIKKRGDEAVLEYTEKFDDTILHVRSPSAIIAVCNSY